MKTFATMFSGGELFGIGAEQAGYKHLWGIEYEDKIASVARLNGFNVLTGSVLDATLLEGLPSPEHLHASPPCPNFSVAKTNNGETEHDIALAQAVCNAILTHKPATFSLENVRGYVKSESYKMILATLEGSGYMVDVQVLDAADFGVPQNRIRLFMRARKDGRVVGALPQPVKWVGWYSAIEDLLGTLPETEFAPWQMERLPQEYREFLIGQGSRSSPKEKDEPADTVTANSNQTGMKAFVVNVKDPHGDTQRFTVPDSEAPIYTILAGATEARTKAFIVDGQPTNYGKTMTIRDGHEPMMTVQSSQDKKPLRAYATGRVVKMTVQALGRFQTVPDTYKGLTTKINGNGVPCLMARRIMESLI